MQIVSGSEAFLPQKGCLSSLREVSEDTVLVDARHVAVEELYAWRQAHPNSTVYVLTEGQDAVWEPFAQAHRMTLVTLEDVSTLLQAEAQSRSDTPILALWGATPRLGTTLLSLTLGRVLSEQYHSVGVLGFNAYNAGHWVFRNEEHALDDLLSTLRTHRLDASVLQSSTMTMGNLRYLPGLRNPLHALDLTVEEVGRLVEVGRTAFDVLILDVGSVLNTALALEGIRRATHRYCVASDRMSVQYPYHQQMDGILKPLGCGPETWMLVGMQMYNHKLEQLAKTLGMLPLAGFAYQDRFDFYAEQQTDPMQHWLGVDRHVKRGLETIAASVRSSAGKKERRGTA
jgi:hypothetical protein